MLGRTRGILVQAEGDHLGQSILGLDPMKLPKLHIAAVGRKGGSFQRTLNHLIGNRRIRVKKAVGTPKIDNFLKGLGMQCLIDNYFLTIHPLCTMPLQQVNRRYPRGHVDQMLGSLHYCIVNHGPGKIKNAHDRRVF